MNPTATRIDVHHHMVPPDYVAVLTQHGITGTGGVDFPTWFPQQSLTLMDRQGIATAVLSLSAPGVFIGDVALACDLARRCNDYAAQCVASAPHRFGAFATLPLPDIGGALREMEYALDVLRCDGIVLLTNYGGHYLGDPAFDEVFAELNRRKTVVFIHPTVSIGDAIPQGNDSGSPIPLPSATLEFPFDTTRAVAYLLASGTLQRSPDVRFILPHAGGTVPYLAAKIATGAVWGKSGSWQQLLEQIMRGLTQLQNLYYDTALSANPFQLGPLQSFTSPTHILFGSDYPWANEAITAANVQGIETFQQFDDQSRQRIRCENALSLFPRLMGQGSS